MTYIYHIFLTNNVKDIVVKQRKLTALKRLGEKTGTKELDPGNIFTMYE